ncbi:uncharacterized protein LOC108738540 [Agrilus planipennis]|uniref:Uncharacterized protein LOC108738540 n=1 Tax=Agrilus planipennis TaxID=224129 RepID=A0A1W4X542_AGRPL|nr:uncharacterized protein LOC108738540 [Agrilus planipennis]
MEQVLNKSFLDNSWYNLRLESESSRTSEGDSESVLSVQGKETDLAQDTPDTDTKSEYSSDEDLYEVEYEVASLSGDDNPLAEDTSSGSEDMLVGAAIAAAICDASMEAWITDGEDSDTSLEEIGLGQTDFLTCIQCKSQNDNPRFSYCEKCFQARKTLFPPRPRRVRPRNKKAAAVDKSVKGKPPIAVANLRSCLSGLSQDSGVGSSQELPKLNLEEIVVPKHLSNRLATTNDRKRTVSDGSDSLFSDTDQEINCRKRANKRSLNDDTLMEPNKKAKVDTNNPEDVKNDKRNVPSVFVVNNECVPSCSGLGTMERVEKGTTTVVHSARVEQVHNGREEPMVGVKDNSSCVSVEKGGQFNGTVPIRGEKPAVLSEPRELCIVCNSQPKNSIFLHGKTGHMCCCYRCAVRTWHACKSCPICKMKVQNVVKVFVCS